LSSELAYGCVAKGLHEIRVVLNEIYEARNDIDESVTKVREKNQMCIVSGVLEADTMAGTENETL
jgi:hypothetical protein